jgi:hypothetical protein
MTTWVSQASRHQWRHASRYPVQSFVDQACIVYSVRTAARIQVKNPWISACAKNPSSSNACHLPNYRSVNTPSVRISHWICKGLHRGVGQGFSNHPCAHAVGGMCGVWIVHESWPQPERGYKPRLTTLMDYNSPPQTGASICRSSRLEAFDERGHTLPRNPGECGNVKRRHSDKPTVDAILQVVELKLFMLGSVGQQRL